MAIATKMTLLRSCFYQNYILSSTSKYYLAIFYQFLKDIRVIRKNSCYKLVHKTPLNAKSENKSRRRVVRGGKVIIGKIKAIGQIKCV